MDNQNEVKTLGELLTETLDLRSLNIEKLAELTDIPLHYLVALNTGDFQKLPPAPYIQGYLMKIAEVLRIDGDLLWSTYKKEVSLRLIKSSGPQDKLPSNRFAIKPANKKILIISGIILIFIIIYLGWRLAYLLGTPKIEISSPNVDNLVVNTPSIKLVGKVSSNDKLTINNEEIFVDSTGQFEKDFSLQPGLNTIEFKVKKFLGKEITIMRRVIYQP